MVLKKDKTGYYGHKGFWVLIATKANPRTRRRRVLRVYGKRKPSKKEVERDERIIEYYKNK